MIAFDHKEERVIVDGKIHVLVPCNDTEDSLGCDDCSIQDLCNEEFTHCDCFCGAGYRFAQAPLIIIDKDAVAKRFNIPPNSIIV